MLFWTGWTIYLWLSFAAVAGGQEISLPAGYVRPTPTQAIAVFLRCCGAQRAPASAIAPREPRAVILRAPAPRRPERVPTLAEIPWAQRESVPWKHVGPAMTPVVDVRIVR
jgi:hypothetical protein